jgi:hypothetical protein
LTVLYQQRNRLRTQDVGPPFPTVCGSLVSYAPLPLT